MRAAVLLFTGCSLPSSDPGPGEYAKTEGGSTSVVDTGPWGSPATGVTDTPQIDVQPDSTDFGSVPIGRYTVQPITVRNVGRADLEIESMLFMPSDPDDMQYFPGPDPDDATSTYVFPLTIPPGEGRDVTITYAPLDETADHGVLTVTSNDPATPTVHAELHGTGVADADTGT